MYHLYISCHALMLATPCRYWQVVSAGRGGGEDREAVVQDTDLREDTGAAAYRYTCVALSSLRPSHSIKVQAPVQQKRERAGLDFDSAPLHPPSPGSWLYKVQFENGEGAGGPSGPVRNKQPVPGVMTRMSYIQTPGCAWWITFMG